MGRPHGTRWAASAVALVTVLSAAAAAAPGSFEVMPAVEAARAEIGGVLRAVTTEEHGERLMHVILLYTSMGQ